MEVDEALDLTAKVFREGVRSNHKISLTTAFSAVNDLREAVSKILELPLTNYDLGK